MPRFPNLGSSDILVFRKGNGFKPEYRRLFFDCPVFCEFDSRENRRGGNLVKLDLPSIVFAGSVLLFSILAYAYVAWEQKKKHPR